MLHRVRGKHAEAGAASAHCPLLPAFCETKTRGEWHIVPLRDAWRLNCRRLLRCTQCHGRIRVHSPSEGRIRPVEHVEPHNGCFFCPDFDGVPRRHPRPMA